jgi:hypothetical protein
MSYAKAELLKGTLDLLLLRSLILSRTMDWASPGAFIRSQKEHST